MPGVPPRAPLRPVRDAYLAVLLLSGALGAAAPDASPADAVPPHLRDLRVLLDYDDDTTTFATWPLDKFGRKLPPDEIARGVRLGLSLWASVLPDMRFRFVNRPEEANLAFRFGPYRNSGFTQDGGRAFLPSEWGSLRLDCGRALENRLPDGSWCQETAHNVILIHQGRWAVKAVDYRDNLSVHAYFTWVFGPRRPHFRTAGGPCRTDTAGAEWAVDCVDFARSPHFREMQGVDLANVVQHEFGHTLVGDHTPSPGEYVDFRRRPVLDPERFLRLTPAGPSIMMPGDAAISWWNSRGLSRHDAERLAALGYRVSYPRACRALMLGRPGMAPRKVFDWREADRLLLWPLQGRPLSSAQSGRQLFLTDVGSEILPGP